MSNLKIAKNKMIKIYIVNLQVLLAEISTNINTISFYTHAVRQPLLGAIV